jgi:hypothetical protein
MNKKETILSFPGQFIKKEKYYPYGKYKKVLKPGMYFILKTEDPEVFEFVSEPSYNEQLGIPFQEFCKRMFEECGDRFISTTPIGYKYLGM